MAAPIEMPFGLWIRVGPRNHVLDGVQIPRGNFEGESGAPLLSIGTLCGPCAKRLNQSRCHLGCGLRWAVGRDHALDVGPAVLRDIAMVTNFGR